MRESEGKREKVSKEKENPFSLQTICIVFMFGQHFKQPLMCALCIHVLFYCLRGKKLTFKCGPSVFANNELLNPYVELLYSHVLSIVPYSVRI